MPLNPNIKFADNVLDKSKVEQKTTRLGFGEGLVVAGESDKNVVALCADLTESTQIHLFKNKFPDRFVEMGVAEQNMAAVASGLAASGKIPFIASYGMFSPGRNWEQLRTTVAYNEQKIIVGVMHSGISVGPDGGTHQAIEDMAITRVIPKVAVINPCDYFEAKKATIAAVKYPLPIFLRFHREKTPLITSAESGFEIGKAEILFVPKDENKIDAAIFACGQLVHNALLAADELEKEGLNLYVVNNHTIKPLDEKTVIEIARKAGAVVTVEEHQIAGGMGSVIAETLVQNYPVPMEFIGVRDQFGQSGEQNELIEYYGMGISHIKNAVMKAINRK